MASVNPKEYIAIIFRKDSADWVRRWKTLTLARDWVKSAMRPGETAEIYEAYSVLTAELGKPFQPDIVWGEA